jgi:hypothetical protein
MTRDALLAALLGLTLCCASQSALGPDAGGADAGAVCPADPSGACSGTMTCTYVPDAGRTRVCGCTISGWRCSDCGDFMSQTATCTAGEHCTFEDWEHGCLCTCGIDDRWHCTKETIGSSCPP